MSGRSYGWLAVASLFFGLLAFISLPLVRAAHDRDFKLKEKYFSSPLVTPEKMLHVRNDGNAKGHFWARRDGGRHHKGVDFLSEEGRPVLASRSGRISFAGEDKGYGLYVEMTHPDGFVTRYAHLTAISVQQGNWISMGQIIGLSGRSGNANSPSIRPHLHYEIRLNGTPLDPTKELLDPKFRIIR